MNKNLVILLLTYILFGNSAVVAMDKYFDQNYDSLSNTYFNRLSEIKSIIGEDVEDKDLAVWGNGDSFAIVTCDSALTTFVAKMSNDTWTVKEINTSENFSEIPKEQLVSELNDFLSDGAIFDESLPSFISGDPRIYGEGAFWFCINRSDGTHSKFFTHPIPDFNFICKPLWLHLMRTFLLPDG